MEEILDVYAQPADPQEPLICMDEASKQLTCDLRPCLPMAPGQPLREDYHYQRQDVQAIFLFFDPIKGWRRVMEPWASGRRWPRCYPPVAASDSRTSLDWAHQVRILLEEDYPLARKVKLVCDNLNTHAIASLYAAFPAPQARALARRLELHHRPRNGSWLNMAEIELSVVSRQCLDRRIGGVQELVDQLAHWQEQRNAQASVVRWRMNIDDARIKLQHLYPQF